MNPNAKRFTAITAADAAEMFFAAMAKEQREERVYVLPLDANGGVLSKPIAVSVGSMDGTADIDVGALFREALKAGAEEIIIAHNHPSGNLTPSKADLRLTEELKSRAEWLGLEFIDHIILGPPNSANTLDFISLAETLP